MATKLQVEKIARIIFDRTWETTARCTRPRWKTTLHKDFYRDLAKVVWDAIESETEAEFKAKREARL